MEGVGGWEAGMPESYGERKYSVPGFREFVDKTESISVVWNVKEKRSLILESILAHCEGAIPQGIEWADQECESSLETRQD